MEELFDEDAVSAEDRRAEQEALRQERAEREAERARRERVWAARYPAEWAEWTRVRLLLNGPIPFGDDPFDFPDFLMEVGRRPSARHVVTRPDEAQPYQPGNLVWAAPAAEPPKSPYLNAEQAAAYLGVAKQTVYNNRPHIPSLPGFRTLMFDPKVLDELRASARFKSLRLGKSGPRKTTS
ncbi:helix-turn-helix domain-containing protein [bacterium]|nr:helix-turn-helix domain-containing protein [bacterium]